MNFARPMFLLTFCAVSLSGSVGSNAAPPPPAFYVEFAAAGTFIKADHNPYGGDCCKTRLRATVRTGPYAILPNVPVTFVAPAGSGVVFQPAPEYSGHEYTTDYCGNCYAWASCTEGGYFDVYAQATYNGVTLSSQSIRLHFSKGYFDTSLQVVPGSISVQGYDDEVEPCPLSIQNGRFTLLAEGLASNSSPSGTVTDNHSYNARFDVQMQAIWTPDPVDAQDPANQYVPPGEWYELSTSGSSFANISTCSSNQPIGAGSGHASVSVTSPLHISPETAAVYHLPNGDPIPCSVTAQSLGTQSIGVAPPQAPYYWETYKVPLTGNVYFLPNVSNYTVLLNAWTTCSAFPGQCVEATAIATADVGGITFDGHDHQVLDFNPVP